MKQRKITLIGYGGIGKMYGEVLLDMPDIAFGSIVEPDSNALQNVKNNIPCYSNLQEMLVQNDRPDAAIICTPPNTHASIAEACLNAGIDCLIEKPLSFTLEEGRKLVALAKKKGRRIAESAKYRNSEPLMEIKKRVLMGDIGSLEKVECTFTGPLDIHHNWRSNHAISGGGVWMDNGPHAIAVVETIAGKTKKIRMERSEKLQGTDVEDEVLIKTEHDHRVPAQIVLSWNKHIAVPYVIVTGTKGVLIGDWKETVLVVNGSKEQIAGGYDKRKAFTHVIKEFLNGGQESGHVLETLQCILAGYKSSLSGHWEQIG